MQYNKNLYEKYGFKVTNEPVSNSRDRNLMAKAERFHHIVTGNKSTVKTVEELKQEILLHPDEASFKNYLYGALTHLGKTSEAFEVLRDTVKKHPDYIFGHINMARHYMYEKEYDKAISILGASYDITLFEKEEYIHFSAFKGYYSVAIELELKKKNNKKAEELHRMLFDYDKNDKLTKELAKLIIASRFLDNPLFEKATNERNVEVISKPITGTYLSEADGKPVFNHSEIHQLYQYSLDKIPKTVIKSILALPRTTLVQDLEHVIMDTILRYDYFQELDWNDDKNSFSVHALYLLTELKSYDSLPVLFDFLRQDEDFMEYWVADWLETYLKVPLYILGENQFQSFKDFVLEENVCPWHRAMVCDVLTQVAIKQVDRRIEVIQWFSEVIHFHLDNPNNDNLIDSKFISSLITSCVELRAIELEEDIQLLFAQGWVNDGFCGYFESVVTDLKKPFNPFYDKPLPKDLDDLYSGEYEKRRNKSNDPIDSEMIEKFNDPYQKYLMDITTQQLINNKYDDDDDYDWTPQLPVKREEPKIGRNDPCPCGSGKKYKKCCGK